MTKEHILHISVIMRAVQQVLVDDDWPNYALTPRDVQCIARRIQTQIDKLSCCSNGSFGRKHSCQKSRAR
jgi:hypothetical protein